MIMSEPKPHFATVNAVSSYLESNIKIIRDSWTLEILNYYKELIENNYYVFSEKTQTLRSPDRETIDITQDFYIRVESQRKKEGW